MFFNSIKEIDRLRQEMNTLLSKGMSNISLKVNIEKNWHSQKSKQFATRPVFGKAMQNERSTD